jgi:ATPase subunit of ABC transporter with duplicated ATPase domains
MADLTKAYGTKKVLENLNISFYPDAKIGILGPNGAGKSTVLKIMAGIDKEWSGEAWLAEGATVGYLAQEPELDPALNVFGNIMEGVAKKTAIIERYNELMMNYSDETADESARLQDEMDRLNLWDLEQQVEMAMEALGCPAKDADVTKLSGGERRRVALCQLLLREPDLLLLDEPTNHLDAETTAWLEKHLRAYKGAVMIITHDRYFLDNVTGWILELDRGRGIPYEGNYTAYLEAKAWMRASAPSAASASGSPPARRRGRPSPRRASRRSRICWSRPTSAVLPTRRSSSRMASVSAMW